MDTKKIAATFAILMIALGVVGFAYAHWSEYLYLEGTVTTGELCLEWSFDYEVWPGNTKYPGTEDEFDVADVGYEFYDLDGDGCYDGLAVWCYNAYPSLWIEGWIDIHNCGTIPAGVYDYDCYIEGTPAYWWETAIDYEYGFVGDCAQIDPCDMLELYFSIHFNEDTPEDAYAEFGFYIEFWNWNELIP